MGLFDSIKNVAGNLIKEAGNSIAKSTSFPIKLSDETLNKAASGLFGADDEIKSLKISMHDGWCQADAHIVHNLAEFDVTVSFEIVRFEVSKTAQVIELRQKGELATDADGWRNKVVVALMKTFVTAILGRNLLHWGLKDAEGVVVSGDTISIDLGKVGAKDALFNAVAEKVGSAVPYLLPLMQGGSDKLADYVAISNAECHEGALQVNVQYAGGDKD